MFSLCHPRPPHFLDCRNNQELCEDFFFFFFISFFLFLLSFLFISRNVHFSGKVRLHLGSDESGEAKKLLEGIFEESFSSWEHRESKEKGNSVQGHEVNQAAKGVQVQGVDHLVGEASDEVKKGQPEEEVKKFFVCFLFCSKRYLVCLK